MSSNANTSSDNEVLQQHLSEASSLGDLPQVKAVLEQWKDKGLGHGEGHTLEWLRPALHAAATGGHASTASFLLDQGLDVDKVAVRAAVSARATDVLQTYLDHGWDINKSLGLGSNPGMTTNSVLNDENLLTWFLAHGASPNARADGGWNALDVAAWLSSPRVLERLVQHGGTLTGQTNTLHMAVRSPKRGRREVVEFLLGAGADINAIEHAGDAAPRGGSVLGTPLHYAARDGKEDLVRLLLEKGADPVVLDTSGRTTAEVALEAGHPELLPILSAATKA